MKDRFCNGFLISEEKDLKKLVSIDEYLDLLHGKNEYSHAEERWTEDIDLCVNDEEDDVDDAWDLGRDLFMARIFSQTTQKQLAKQIGISVSSIARLEKGLFPRAKGERIHIHEKTKKIVQEYIRNNL